MNTGTILRAGVVGHPVKHSRSPIIHGYWLEQFGINGRYDRYDVKPEDFSHFVKTLSEQGLQGVNVTIPHKEAAFLALDEATDRARRLKAANTLWFENGKLWGDNTDSIGFLANLDQGHPGWDINAKSALILGAGGAARAIIAGLQERNIEKITIVNRTRERAEELALMSGGQVAIAEWSKLSFQLESADLVVNTTSLGMSGQPDLDLSLDPLGKNALVTDIVYVPLETNLLKQARLRGNPVVDGLGMLLHQAVPGFEHWFGKRPVVTDALRHLVEDHITGIRA
ncbi:MAG: shikimate dehydrogenase [Pseudomonadota bacterium]|jgi:shikimate dehydrogenase